MDRVYEQSYLPFPSVSSSWARRRGPDWWWRAKWSGTTFLRPAVQARAHLRSRVKTEFTAAHSLASSHKYHQISATSTFAIDRSRPAYI